MSDREKIRDRIRALREKTTGRGCTEEEAMAAAAKAAELMGRHGLTEADLVIEEASSILRGKRHSALNRLWAIIAMCTNTAALGVSKGRADGILFIGQAPGPDIAVYLRDVCDRAIARQLVLFKAGTFYRRRRTIITKKATVADFLSAAVDRLGDRLLVMFEPTISEAARNTAIAVRDGRYRTKSANIAEHDTRFSEAAWAGSRAADAVHLAHGVDGAPAPALHQIGRTP